MIGIYKITNNVNKKVYIGQSIDIKRRWREHKKCKDLYNPLYQDMKVNRIDNFSFDVIEECSQQQLNEREQFWISYYDSYKNGYNRTIGGEGSFCQNNIDNSSIKLTNKQWLLYYYMINLANILTDEQTNLRINKNFFNISETCKNLGIKSTQTFYNTLAKLCDNNLIKIDCDYYYITPNFSTDYDKAITEILLKPAKVNSQNIDLLRTYLYLKELNKTSIPYDKDFSIRNICFILGHGDTNSICYTNIRLYLNLLNSWGLINIEQREIKNVALGNYAIYHLQDVSRSLNYDNFNSHIDFSNFSKEQIKRIKKEFNDFI